MTVVPKSPPTYEADCPVSCVLSWYLWRGWTQAAVPGYGMRSNAASARPALVAGPFAHAAMKNCSVSAAKVISPCSISSAITRRTRDVWQFGNVANPAPVRLPEQPDGELHMTHPIRMLPTFHGDRVIRDSRTGLSSPRLPQMLKSAAL